MTTMHFFTKRGVFASLFIGFILACAGCETLTEPNKQDVSITWENPADIEYGTPLSATQLNATTSIPGVFKYTPPAGTILEIGNNLLLTVDFTPTDSITYSNATKTVVINVLKAKSWVYSQTIIQFAEPYKAHEFTIVDDVPWNVVFSKETKSTVYSGEEFNVTRTAKWTNLNGELVTASKTDTWSEPPAEIIPKQEYTMKMETTRINGLGNGMSIGGFGTLEEAMEGLFPIIFQESAFAWDGEKSLTIKVNEPINDEDALKKRVLRVHLSSGALGTGTENDINYLYVYEWK